MKRLFAVIALGAALSLSTNSFARPAGGADDDCEVTSDLSVTGTYDMDKVGDSEITGNIVNQSRSRGYDDVMIRVDFINDNLSTTNRSDLGERDMDRDLDNRDMDVDVDHRDMDNEDITMDNDNDQVTIQSEDHDLTIESDDVDLDRDNNSGAVSTTTDQDSKVIGSQVFTIKEDVEPGEVESFHLNVTPPAGTTRVAYSVVCADND